MTYEDFCVLIFQVSDWWEKYVYLHGRSPIMVNSNYYVMVQNRQPFCNGQILKNTMFDFVREYIPLLDDIFN